MAVRAFLQERVAAVAATNGSICRQGRSHGDTLHGGIYGWDWRNWTILARTDTSVTYHHLDAADEGFPGDVEATVRSSPPSLHLVFLAFTLTQTARGDR